VGGEIGGEEEAASGLGCPGLCCQLLIWIGMGIFWFWIYLGYKDVVCEHPLPMWCLVNCIVSFGGLPASCLANTIRVHGLQNAAAGPSLNVRVPTSIACLSGISCLLVVFQTVCFILGNYWAFGQNELECDAGLLKAVRYYFIATYVVIGAICCCTCLVARSAVA